MNETKAQATRSSFGRRIRQVLLGTVAACIASSVAVTPAALASTPPADYAYLAPHCIATVDDNNSPYLQATFEMPDSVTNYTGTVKIAWDALIQVAVNGQWRNLEQVDVTTAIDWLNYGNQLGDIAWGGQPLAHTASTDLPIGYAYRVIGQTYWSNGQRWFYSSNTVLGTCVG